MKETARFPWSKWTIASFSAGFGGALAVIGYLNGQVYSRVEGEILSKRMDTFETSIGSRIDTLQTSLNSALLFKGRVKNEEVEEEYEGSDDLLADPQNAKKPSEPRLTKSN